MKNLWRIILMSLIAIFMGACTTIPATISEPPNNSVYFDKDYPYNKQIEAAKPQKAKAKVKVNVHYTQQNMSHKNYAQHYQLRKQKISLAKHHRININQKNHKNLVKKPKKKQIRHLAKRHNKTHKIKNKTNLHAKHRRQQDRKIILVKHQRVAYNYNYKKHLNKKTKKKLDNHIKKQSKTYKKATDTNKKILKEKNKAVDTVNKHLN